MTIVLSSLMFGLLGFGFARLGAAGGGVTPTPPPTIFLEADFSDPNHEPWGFW